MFATLDRNVNEDESKNYKINLKITIVFVVMLVALQSCISDDMTALQKDPLPEANTHVSMDQARQRLIKVLGKTEPATRGFSVNIGEGIALNKEAEHSPVLKEMKHGITTSP